MTNKSEILNKYEEFKKLYSQQPKAHIQQADEPIKVYSPNPGDFEKISQLASEIMENKDLLELSYNELEDLQRFTDYNK